MKFAKGEDKSSKELLSIEPVIPYDDTAPIIDENTGISKWETVSVKHIAEEVIESTPLVTTAVPKINTNKNLIKFEKIGKPIVKTEKTHLDSDEEDEDKYLAKFGHSSLIRQPESSENVRETHEKEDEKVSFSFKKRKHNITTKSTSVGIE